MLLSGQIHWALCNYTLTRPECDPLSEYSFRCANEKTQRQWQSWGSGLGLAYPKAPAPSTSCPVGGSLGPAQNLLHFLLGGFGMSAVRVEISHSQYKLAKGVGYWVSPPRGGLGKAGRVGGPGREEGENLPETWAVTTSQYLPNCKQIKIKTKEGREGCPEWAGRWPFWQSGRSAIAVGRQKAPPPTPQAGVSASSETLHFGGATPAGDGWGLPADRSPL